MEKRKVKNTNKLKTLVEQQQKADIHLKRLDAQEKYLRINDWERRRLINDAGWVEANKIQVMVSLMWCHVIDTEKDFPGSEQRWKPVLTDAQRNKVVAKMMSIIERM